MFMNIEEKAPRIMTVKSWRIKLKHENIDKRDFELIQTGFRISRNGVITYTQDSALIMIRE